jgi:hypothetical protein
MPKNAMALGKPRQPLPLILSKRFPLRVLCDLFKQDRDPLLFSSVFSSENLKRFARANSGHESSPRSFFPMSNSGCRG